MRRREFITLLSGAAAAWPLGASAQQGERMRRIGLLSGNAREDVQSPPSIAAFTKGLQALGWTDGQNLKIEYRWSAGNLDLMKVYARELVALKLDLIVAHTTQVVAALRQETTTIPIVFVVVSDPVGSGFVNSLANPGGNITGFINIESSLGGKWVELLKEVAALPTLRSFSIQRLRPMPSTIGNHSRPRRARSASNRPPPLFAVPRRSSRPLSQSAPRPAADSSSCQTFLRGGPTI